MDTKNFLIPARIGSLLSRLPAYPGSILAAQGLNTRLSALLPEDLRRLLRDKKICIAVTDAHVTFHFKWNGERFIACSGDAIPDLKISAGAHDFLRLATRSEDPDTLFFNRRLVMEGDTELGLAVKNMLDALETPVFRAEHLAPVELLNTIRAGIARKRGARVANH